MSLKTAPLNAMTAKTNKVPRIVVLISGSGSNLQAIIDACKDGSITANIVAVISNRPNAFGLERAIQSGIDALTLDHTEFDSREAFDEKLQAAIDHFQADLVVLAGFMRILTPAFTEHYLGRMLNIHPSLLPKYPGLHTHQRALEAGDKEHGATVHFVTPVLDDGPNIIHATVPVDSEDTAETLAQKVHKIEHLIYPKAVEWFTSGRLVMTPKGALLDGQPLSPSGATLGSN